MTIVTAFLFLAWGFCAGIVLSCFRCSGGLFPVDKRSPYTLLSLFFALASFLFIAPGCLPPLYNTAWGGIALLGCLFLSVILERRRHALVPLSLVGMICAVVWWFAWNRGMPGTSLNLGTFVAIPVWNVVTWSEIPAFLLLSAGFVLAAYQFALQEKETLPLISSLRQMAIWALFVTLFLSWNFASHLSWPNLAVASLDFIFFWVKIFLCVYSFSLLPRCPGALPLSLLFSLLGLMIIHYYMT